MLVFFIFAAIGLMIACYCVVYIGECVCTGFTEIAKIGGNVIDERIISTRKRTAKPNHRCR